MILAANFVGVQVAQSLVFYVVFVDFSMSFIAAMALPIFLRLLNISLVSFTNYIYFKEKFGRCIITVCKVCTEKYDLLVLIINF